ncbi:MAG: hypothetical protein AAB759_01935 [Patescibacteria group bacterium]
MSKRSLTVITGVILIIAGIIIGFVMYGRGQVNPEKTGGLEKTFFQEDLPPEGEERGNTAVLGATSPSAGVSVSVGLPNQNKESASDINANNSANIISAVAERLASLSRDLVLLQNKESGAEREAVLIELDNLKGKLIALRAANLENQPAREEAARGIVAAGSAINDLGNTEMQNSSRRADLMVTLTAIGERLVKLGGLISEYQALVARSATGNLVSVTYQ